MAGLQTRKSKFSKVLSKNLRAHFDDASCANTSLHDELKIEQAMLMESLEQQAYLVALVDAGGKENIDATVLAQVKVEHHLDRVLKMAQAAARIESMGQVNVMTAAMALDSATRIMSEELSRYENVISVEPQLILNDIEKRFETDLQITDASAGTKLTPDMDAQRMDATVPVLASTNGSNGNGKR